MQARKNFLNYIEKHLLIVDVQKDFEEYFPDNYINELNTLASEMKYVYQIWDKNQNDEPDYKFPNEVMSTYKYYGDSIDVDSLTEESLKEYNDDSKANFYYDSEYEPKKYNVKDGGFYIYIGMGNNGPGHEWFLVRPNIIEFMETLKNKLGNNILFLAGGAEKECLYDVEIALEFAFNIKYKKLTNYTYSA